MGFLSPELIWAFGAIATRVIPNANPAPRARLNASPLHRLATAPPSGVVTALADVPAPAVSTSMPMSMNMGDDHDHVMQIPNGPALHIRGFFDFNFDTGSVAQNLQYPLGVPATSSFRSSATTLLIC